MLAPCVRPQKPRPQGGFSILDLLVSIAVLAIALLSQISSTMSNHVLMEQQEERELGVGAARQLIARLRSDDDWGGLYGTLLFRQKLAGLVAPLRFPDGSRAWRPQTYYSDYVDPAGIEDIGVLVEVPQPVPLEGEYLGWFDFNLREDVVDPAFDLPADLNSDATINSEPRNDDYVYLPVIVRVRWRNGKGGVDELRLATWLRGER